MIIARAAELEPERAKEANTAPLSNRTVNPPAMRMPAAPEKFALRTR